MFRTSPVATFLMDICTQAITAPDLSLTVPESVPPATCAGTGRDAASTKIANAEVIAAIIEIFTAASEGLDLSSSHSPDRQDDMPGYRGKQAVPLLK